jgi:hypothetical protein
VGCATGTPAGGAIVTSTSHPSIRPLSGDRRSQDLDNSDPGTVGSHRLRTVISSIDHDVDDVRDTSNPELELAGVVVNQAIGERGSIHSFGSRAAEPVASFDAL